MESEAHSWAFKPSIQRYPRRSPLARPVGDWGWYYRGRDGVPLEIQQTSNPTGWTYWHTASWPKVTLAWPGQIHCGKRPSQDLPSGGRSWDNHV